MAHVIRINLFHILGVLRVTDFQINGCVGTLFVEECGDEGLVSPSVGDEHASGGVAGFCSSVYANAGASGYLDEDGHERSELGRAIDLHLVGECRNYVVGVFKGGGNRCKVLVVDTF